MANSTKKFLEYAAVAIVTAAVVASITADVIILDD